MTSASPERILARRQAVHRAQIAQHKARLIKRANQIFTRREIDAHLAADRTVHLRQQCCGRLHKIDPPQINRRDKSRQVPDDSAAQRDDE